MDIHIGIHNGHISYNQVLVQVYLYLNTTNNIVTVIVFTKMLFLCISFIFKATNESMYSF